MNTDIEYINNFTKIIERLDTTKIDSIVKRLLQVSEKRGVVYFAGNGGSCSMANHFSSDFMKTISEISNYQLKTQSLVSNSSDITAISNDYDFQHIFEKKLNILAEKEDCLIVISSSGNSKNIINAVKLAKVKGLYTVGFIGFDGGKVKDLVDDYIHIQSFDYGIVESAHSFVFHLILNKIKSLEGY